MAEDELRIAALEYHERPAPGKISVTPTKSLANQRDLSLAYSPGVAYACESIKDDPLSAARYTARANLVAVVSNGSAVLGLGNIGALAGKPVMEGKGCLFKKFAGIDVFDIEIDESDPDRIVDIVAALEPTFGGINLEDIKAPECFYIERKLRERMTIPVFHDDQHGTAIVSGAAVLNALEIVGKDIADVKLVCSGAGAAALACLDLLMSLGLKIENIFVSDIDGVVYKGRKAGMDPNKERFARETEARTLNDIIGGADIFLGLSAGGVLKPEMVKKMAERPIILAMANPEPEIRPEAARAARPDCLIGTGRSDYPNQVNNSLCFPFIFRGALDVGATTINEEMKLAAVQALAQIARAEPSEIVALAYGEQTPAFGPEYLIPRAFDPRLIERIAPAVARAAMESGVATRPITDWSGYRRRLSQFVYQSGATMMPVFESAKRAPKRVVYAEGEDERVLRAALVAVDEGIAHPILIGRPQVIAAQISRLGLRLRAGQNFELVDPQNDPRYEALWREYFALTARDGTTREEARHEMRDRYTAVGAMLVRRGEADAMLCGTYGDYRDHLKPVRSVIGLRPGVKTLAAMQMVILPGHQVFICDTHINVDPSAEQIAEIALLAAEEVRGFGVTPAAALVSHSSFGSSDAPSAIKMREALALIRAHAPDLEIDGEMRADAALSPPVRETLVPDSMLKGPANLLIMPSVDAANIAYNLLRIAAGGGIIVGGILLGLARPVHIMTPSSTVRRLVNMTAVAVVDAGARASSPAAAQGPQAA
jgi:malate dehydrogenase (oxaloacetate-decarboxylating)(NADP+)